MCTLLRSAFEMLPDVAGILLAALSFSLIFLPKELRVLEAPKWKRLRWTLAAIFAVVGIGGVASNAIQKAKDKAARNELNQQVAQLKDQVSKVQRKLNQDTSASVSVISRVPLNDAQEISSEQPIKFNIAYGITQNTAKNLRQFTILKLENSRPDSTHDKSVWARFRGLSTQGISETGQDKMFGTYVWKTLEINLSKSEAKDIKAGTKTLYILGLVLWNNPSGTDGHLNVCMWLQKPKTKILTPATVWHDCSL